MPAPGVTSLLTEMGHSTSVTPYGLCEYRCVYCCTGVQGPSRSLVDRLEAVATMKARLAEAGPRHVFLIGALCDAYPTVERECRITRAIVEVLVDAKRSFTIVTKGDVVLRDLDLLTAEPGLAHVQVSVCSTDEDVLRRLDPGAPSGAVRFEVIDRLREAGVRVGLNLLPWIPDVSDTPALLERVGPDVEVVLSPLAFGEGRDVMQILGRRYTRAEVWRRYRDEYQRFGHLANTSWIRPALPPNENYPMRRLPVLAS